MGSHPMGITGFSKLLHCSHQSDCREGQHDDSGCSVACLTPGSAANQLWIPGVHSIDILRFTTLFSRREERMSLRTLAMWETHKPLVAMRVLSRLCAPQASKAALGLTAAQLTLQFPQPTAPSGTCERRRCR